MPVSDFTFFHMSYVTHTATEKAIVSRIVVEHPLDVIAELNRQADEGQRDRVMILAWHPLTGDDIDRLPALADWPTEAYDFVSRIA